MLRGTKDVLKLALLLALPSLVLSPAPAAAPQKKPVERYTLSGTVTGLAAGHHAVVKATKVYAKETHSAGTRADGGYTLRGLTPGNYTIRPSHSRYHFNPSFRSVVVRDADRVDIDFKAIPNAPKQR